MKLLLDMNLSPSWVPVLQEAGFAAIHWVQVGERTAPDTEILAWARSQGYAIVTNDLDFGTLLALTAAAGPSVIQLRGLRLAPRDAAPLLIPTLRQFQDSIEAGALLILDENSSRVRLLPLKSRSDPAPRRSADRGD